MPFPVWWRRRQEKLDSFVVREYNGVRWVAVPYIAELPSGEKIQLPPGTRLRIDRESYGSTNDEGTDA